MRPLKEALRNTASYFEALEKHPDAIVLWHTRHSCGHAVFWNDPMVALAVSSAPCPWCGGAAGVAYVPAAEPACYDPRTGLLAIARPSPDGSYAVPPELGDGDHVITRHRADESCCHDLAAEPAAGKA